jgi:hypothetical protein
VLLYLLGWTLLALTIDTYITGIDVAVVVPLATDDLVLGVTIIGIGRLSTTPTVEDRVARAMLVKPR